MAQVTLIDAEFKYAAGKSRDTQCGPRINLPLVLALGLGLDEHRQGEGVGMKFDKVRAGHRGIEQDLRRYAICSGIGFDTATLEKN